LYLGTVLKHGKDKDLSEWIRPGGLPVPEVVALLTPLAEAVDHLHGQGTVYRDLKPSNVRVLRDGRVFLVERAGAASGSELAGEASLWIPPEQADARSVTAAADVYAFGLIAYALLSGRMPWNAGEPEQRVQMNKMMGKLTPLSSVVPGLPSVVSKTVMKALSVRPDARQKSCGAVVVFLDEKRRAAANRDARRQAAEQAAADKARAFAAAKAKRESAARARREAEARAKEQQRAAIAARKQAEIDRRRAKAGPHPHTHHYEGPFVEKRAVERTRRVVGRSGFLGMGKQVRHETYTAEEENIVTRQQERPGERFVLEQETFIFVAIPAGTYKVEGRGGEGRDAARPQQAVEFTRAFAIGAHPVTQGLWTKVMGTNPSKFKGKPDSAQRPVERVSWLDAVSFCNKLSVECGLQPAYRIEGEGIRCDFTTPGFRLPTEHEWETAAGAGMGLGYPDTDDPEVAAWYGDSKAKETHAVGTKAVNAWGVFDMNGNVWEWVWDRYDVLKVSGATLVDPEGPQNGAARVLRGGSWYRAASNERVALRFLPSYRRGNDLGCRLARTLI